MSIKQRLYDSIVKRNENVQYEYERYVQENLIEHYIKRLRHWKILRKLIWHYQVKGNEKPLLYWDKPNNNITVEENKKDIERNLSESEACNKQTAISFASQLAHYNIVSFDIFDTLIFRPFGDPRDLFYIVGKKLNILEFKTLRMEAEQEARKKAQAKYGNGEITLEEIYSYLEKKTGLNAEKGVQVELDTELELCYANPYMLRVYKLLLSLGVRMIAVSDMYLSELQIKKLLDKCGYTSFERVFVSSEYKCSKRNKGLYKVVKKIYKPEEVSLIHIGDNYETDIESAREEGIATRFYPNINHSGNKLRELGMSDLIGSAYKGVVNAWLRSGIKTYNSIYEYGFVYGGIYVLGYCFWIHKKAEEHGVDKVIFLSRDGHIYKKIYEKLFPEAKSEYLHWSRIANVKTTIKDMRANFLNSTVRNKAADDLGFTMDALLKSLNLEELVESLPQYGLKGESVLVRENYRIIEELLVDNWAKVIEAYKPYELAAREVIELMIKDCSKIAIIDVGWTGSGPLGIKSLIENKWNMDCKVHCYVAASRVWGHDANITQLTEEKLEPYIFSRFYNRNLYDLHANTNNNTNNIYFELFTQDQTPSFGGYLFKDNNLELQFDIPEVENYETINLIHKGIEDFCDEYLKRFESAKWLLNISGYDAYIPYRHIINNLDFVKENFADFKFVRGISADVTEQRLDSLSDIWEKAKL